MAILVTDLSFKRAEVMDDSDSSGGRPTNTDIGSNLLPNVTGVQREQGATKYRKFYLKNENKDGSGYPLSTLYDSRAYLKQISPAGDAVYLKAADGVADTWLTHKNTSSWQTLGWAGVGTLKQGIAANATQLVVMCEQNGATGNIFFPGTVLIDDGVNVEFLAVSAVTWSGLEATLTFATTPIVFSFARYSHTFAADTGAQTGETTVGSSIASLPNNDTLVGKIAYVSSGTGVGQFRRIVVNTTGNKTLQLQLEYAWETIPIGATIQILKTNISMCVPLGNIVAGVSNIGVPNGRSFTSAGNLKTYPVGATTETWTVRVVSGSPATVSVEGSVTGPLTGPNGDGSFNVSPQIRPPTANGLSYYFEIKSAAWGGGWSAGPPQDALTFTTTAAASGLWVKQAVPAQISAHLANSWELGATGDTV